MPDDIQKERTGPSIEVDTQLTPTQCNEIIEEKLTHLFPVLENALVSCQRVSYGLQNGEPNWSAVFKRAMERHLQENL